MNAKYELLETLQEINKTKENIVAINIKLYSGILEKFIVVRVKTIDDIDKLDVNYDVGYGAQFLYGLVLFDDGTWLSRYEYDGSECWEYNHPITKEYVDDFFGKEKGE